MSFSLCCLNEKYVINIADGRKLGRIIDMEFSDEGNILSISVPGDKSFFKNLTQEPMVIPWNQIVKIGEDIVVVDLMICNISPK